MKKINLILMVLSFLAVQTLVAVVLDMEKKDKIQGKQIKKTFLAARFLAGNMNYAHQQESRLS